MNIPNFLTIIRIGLSGAMLFALVSTLPYGATVALALFLVAAITDALDGYLARKVCGVTPLGALLDPLADKIMVCCAFVGFVELQILPAWIVVLILAREFLITGLRVLAGSHGMNISAGAWGKHKTFWQIVVIVLVLLGLSVQRDWFPDLWTANKTLWFGMAARVLAAGAAIVTVVSGVLYAHAHRKLITDHWNRSGTLPGDMTS